MISFLLNDTLQTIEHMAPSTCVLDFLRTSMALTGTKEGCAAGDCGACSVAVGELKGDQVIYQAINACITPLGSLHGKHLITVEYLSQKNALHPVQQAMVSCHGSQCGFCTPGIIMSLFTWYENVKSGRLDASRHSVELALSGNLCRCTGYQPIFRAAEQALKLPSTFDSLSALSSLKMIAAAKPGHVSDGQQHFFIPNTLLDLYALIDAHPNARLVAGATDLGLEFTQQLKSEAVLIYLGQVRELLELADSASALTIGAACTYKDIHSHLELYFPAFATLLNRLGSLQIRNQGTLGGNVANASPIGDTPPVLLALNAKFHLAGSAGNREVAADDFFSAYRQTQLRPNECLKAIEIPKLGADETLKVYKISKRFDDDISAVCMGLWLKMEGDIVTDCRMGFGGMAATPMRASQTEQQLIGQCFDDATVATAGQALAKEFSPIDDVRATADYRLAVAASLLKRAQYEMQGGIATDLFAELPTTLSGGYDHA